MAGDAEDLHGLGQLGHTALGERLALVQESVGVLAVLAARCGEEDDPVSVMGGFGHYAPRSDGFIVGMGVKTNQGGHEVAA